MVLRFFCCLCVTGFIVSCDIKNGGNADILVEMLRKQLLLQVIESCHSDQIK